MVGLRWAEEGNDGKRSMLFPDRSLLSLSHLGIGQPGLRRCPMFLHNNETLMHLRSCIRGTKRLELKDKKIRSGH